MSESRRLRLGPTRAEVLHHLRKVGAPVAVAEVAAAVGLHINSTRFHLDALTATGLVLREVEQRDQPGRPKVLYKAVPARRGSHYQDLAQVMVRHFAGALEDRSRLARDAGRAWGEELRSEYQKADPGQEPLQRVVAAMTDLGYEPALEPAADPVIELVPCPYGRIASDDPQVVCQLHRGLVEGLLGPDQPLEVRSIEPFVTPTRCLVRLARRPGPPEAAAGPDAATVGAADA